ncbi:conserved hypothetical protein [Culex quinquefasciatus]|uniref:RRM domain-containing protein n=1 Tax=Culex quinquefasciatus TaxID=7176 RepID=B0WJQ7_CULQU|nr:conserved hypothetical protein [Culex quinquefasciatus]|eukprot:XP_001848941.1 conserved hypothetical protein [Culex quinquefasciatus]
MYRSSSLKTPGSTSLMAMQFSVLSCIGCSNMAANTALLAERIPLYAKKRCPSIRIFTSPYFVPSTRVSISLDRLPGTGSALAIGELNGKDLGEGLKLKLESVPRPSSDGEGPPKHDQGVCLYIKIMEASVSSERLQDLFSPFGPLISVKVFAGVNGLGQRAGFVRFVSKEDATRAIAEMDGKVVGNGPLSVTFALVKDAKPPAVQPSKPKGSSKKERPTPDKVPAQTQSIKERRALTDRLYLVVRQLNASMAGSITAKLLELDDLPQLMTQPVALKAKVDETVVALLLNREQHLGQIECCSRFSSNATTVSSTLAFSATGCVISWGKLSSSSSLAVIEPAIDALSCRTTRYSRSERARFFSSDCFGSPVDSTVFWGLFGAGVDFNFLTIAGFTSRGPVPTTLPCISSMALVASSLEAKRTNPARCPSADCPFNSFTEMIGPKGEKSSCNRSSVTAASMILTYRLTPSSFFNDCKRSDGGQGADSTFSFRPSPRSFPFSSATA